MEKWILTADQVKIHYQLCGRGPVMIFLHGNSQSMKVFKKQVAYFSKSYTCLTIDTRAHGQSIFLGERMTFRDLSEDVFSILDKENIKKATLLGFSDGANTAMLLAALQPERFTELILNAGNLNFNGLYSVLRFIFSFINQIKNWFKIKSPTLELLTEDTGLDLTDLSQISAKTLVLIGQFDVIKYGHARAIKNAIPHAKLIIAPFASHLFFRTQPHRFNRIVSHFLKSVSTDKH